MFFSQSLKFLSKIYELWISIVSTDCLHQADFHLLCGLLQILLPADEIFNKAGLQGNDFQTVISFTNGYIPVDQLNSLCSERGPYETAAVVSWPY